MNTLQAIIVENEPLVLESLRYKINEYCPDLKIVAECQTAKKAIEQIKRLRPDVVFLDIGLDTMTGFDVLEAVASTAFEVIVTTDHDEFEYAEKAIRRQVIDFLVKPVKKNDLVQAVQLLKRRIEERSPVSSRLGLPVATGQKFLDVADILYVEANDTRCLVHLVPKQKEPNQMFDPSETPIKVPRLLKEMEAQLLRYGFCRPNNKVLINLNHLAEYVRNDGGWVVLSNGKYFSVTNPYRRAFHDCQDRWFRRA